MKISLEMGKPKIDPGTVGSGNTQVFVCDEHFILRDTWPNILIKIQIHYMIFDKVFLCW